MTPTEHTHTEETHDLHLRYANLLAAARATINAAADGDPAALAYLADELADQDHLHPVLLLSLDQLDPSHLEGWR